MHAGCAGGLAIASRMTRGLAAIGVLSAAGFSSAVLCGAAQAQDPGAGVNEVPIGAFRLGTPHDGFSVVEPPAGVPQSKRDGADDGGGRWFFQGWDQTPSQTTAAEALYKNAIEALKDGRREEAQDLFERLIAAAPDSPRARAARHHLGQIYRGAETEAQAAAPAPRANDAGEPALPWAGGTEAATSASLEVSQALPRAALYQARVAPAIDARFLSDAGDRVFFGPGNADLGIRARGVIQSQARFLTRFPDLFVAIEGHADDGPLADAESLRLSEQRAAVVRERLIAEGVKAERLVAYGRGREERVSDCPAPECMAQNRRVVTILLNRRIEARSAHRAQGASGPSTSSPTQ